MPCLLAVRLPRSLYDSALSYFARLRVTGEQLQVQWRHSDASAKATRD